MKNLMRTARCCFSMLIVCTALMGCSKERVMTEDPDEIERQRQAHIEMTRREMQER